MQRIGKFDNRSIYALHVEWKKFMIYLHTIQDEGDASTLSTGKLSSFTAPAHIYKEIQKESENVRAFLTENSQNFNKFWLL